LNIFAVRANSKFQSVRVAVSKIHCQTARPIRKLNKPSTINGDK